MPKFKFKLFDHQVEAVEKLVNNNSFLLGDVCGLGKTISALQSALLLFESKSITHCLIIVPASIRKQWEKEIYRITGKHPIVVMGSNKGRCGKFKATKKKQLFKAVYKNKERFTVISYAVATRCVESLKNMITASGKNKWLIICDEISRIKNHITKRSKAIKEFNPRYRWGLSGTIIENKAEEAYSIMQWIDSDVFGSFHSFNNRYILRGKFQNIVGYRNVDELKGKIQPYLLRRTKRDVKGLPEVLSQTRYVQFSDYERRIYNRVTEEVLATLEEEGEKVQSGMNILTRFTVLRQICNDTRILLNSNSWYANMIRKAIKLKPSSKLEELADTLDEILSDPYNKVIIFSSFVEMLKLIEEVIKEANLPYAKVYGNYSEGELLKDSWEHRIGLFSDKGAYGLDFPEVNYVINFDLPYNPAVLEQRSSRIRRISSPFKNVTVINLIVDGSIEERTMQILERKTTLAETILNSNKKIIPSRFDLNVERLVAFLKTSKV